MSGHPIVLAHGGGRFDILLAFIRDRLPAGGAVRSFNRIVGDRLGYFRYIRRALAERGFEVHDPTLSFVAPLAKRAEDLKRAVERILAPHGPSAKVHLIGHSMGGLDARYMIARLGMADRVAGLVTIGTPHLGTGQADYRLVETQLPRRLIELVSRTGLDFRGFEDLTTARCRAFNAEVEAAEAANGVTYITYTSTQEKVERVFLLLRRAWARIREREGPNDGLVSAASQRWTDVLRGSGAEKKVERRDFPLPADHLNQIGWWHPWTGPLRERQTFERTIRDVYVQIAEDLRARAAST